MLVTFYNCKTKQDFQEIVLKPNPVPSKLEKIQILDTLITFMSENNHKNY